MFKAESFSHLSLGIASAATIVLATQPARAQVVQVTGVQLNPTPEGLEVLLETSDGVAPEVITASDDRTLQIDLLDTSLNLPEQAEFRRDNPTADITSVTVTTPEPNRVRVSVTGVSEVPNATIAPSPQGLVLSVTPAPEIPETVEDPIPEVPVAEPPTEEIELIVTATRTEEDPLDVPRSVTVITRQELEEQTAISSDLGDILGTAVPGFGPPNQLRTTRGQTLRGREALILIDGVPLNTNFRINRQELRSIDPAAIERIEVVRGPSPIYGGEATGGIINIITRRPSTEKVTVSAEAGVTASIGELEEDGFGNRIQATVSGLSDGLEYAFTFAREDAGSFFDAEGDRIVSEASLSDSTSINILGKVGVLIDDNQRFQVSGNYFSSERDTEFIASPETLLIPGRQKARPLEIEGLEREDNPQDENLVLNASYTNEDLFGSRLQAQLYYQEATARGEFADGRVTPEFFPTLFQSRLEAERWGGRLQIETPIIQQNVLSLLWGADYSNEENVQLTDIFDEETFDRDRELRKVDELTFTPPYDLENLGFFAQLEWNATPRLSLNGGVRYENITVAVDDYTAIDGRDIEGGELNPDDVVFNLGTVYDVTDEVSVFASFSQGFSVPNVGRIFRRPPRGFVSVEDEIDLTEPVKVDEYELGFRGNFDRVQFSVAGFFNYSDLGASLVADAAGILGFERAPQRVYGVEATVDWQPSDRWQLGGLLSWSEGENDPDDDDDFVALTSGEIQPLKLTVYVENETLPGWRNRLQALYVGGRDRAAEAGVDPVGIDSYFLVDFISSVRLGPGELQVGVENLFDNQYFPAVAQFLSGFSDLNYVGGRGRTIRVFYSLTW